MRNTPAELTVDVVTELGVLQELEGDWGRVYSADPEAELFLSFDWAAIQFSQNVGSWLVLVVRLGDAPGRAVAFMPLRLRTRQTSTGLHYHQFVTAAAPTADYTGLICDPAHERAAIEACCIWLRGRGWRELRFEHLLISERRMAILLQKFHEPGLELVSLVDLAPRDGISQFICPYVDLPSTFDELLGGFGTNTRQKIRRYLRKVDGGTDDLTHGTVEPADFEAQFKTLLELWDRRWRTRKGQRADKILAAFRHYIPAAHARGLVHFPTLLWQGRLVCGAINLVDRRKGKVLFFLTGRDESCHVYPLGLILHAVGMRWAITEGFRRYDFLRGNEPYKYQFASSHRRITDLVIRRSGSAAELWLDEIGLEKAIAGGSALEQAGRLAEARSALDQLAKVAPTDARVHGALGRLAIRQGRWDEAVTHLERAVDLDQNSHQGWLLLGDALRHVDPERAVPAYQAAIRRKPESALAHNNLGCTLYRLGHPREAVENLDRALALQPGFAQAAANRQRIEAALAVGATTAH